MPTPTSHPTLISFNGTSIGFITSFRVSASTAVLTDVTNVSCTVLDRGTVNARAVLQYECTAVDPGGADVGVYGCPPFLARQTGMVGNLLISGADFTINLSAILETFDVSGNVGEFLKGTIKFRFNGSPQDWI